MSVRTETYNTDLPPLPDAYLGRDLSLFSGSVAEAHAEVALSPEQQSRDALFAACLAATPPETEQNEYALVKQALDKYADLQPTLEGRQGVGTAADYLLWKAFPGTVGTMPADVHAYAIARPYPATGKALSVDIDPGNGVTTGVAMQVAGDILKDPAVRESMDMRRKAILSNPDVDQAARACVRATPVYQLLESFRQPPSDGQAERPLSPYEQLVKETAVEADVRLRHGLAAKAAMPVYTAAGRELRQRLQMMDDDTIRTERPAPDDGLGRLKGFIEMALDEYIVAKELGTSAKVGFYPGRSIGPFDMTVIAEDPIPVGNDMTRDLLKSSILEAVQDKPVFMHDPIGNAQDMMLDQVLTAAFSGHIVFETATLDKLLDAVEKIGTNILKSGVGNSFILHDDTGFFGDFSGPAAWLRGVGWKDAERLWEKPYRQNPIDFIDDGRQKRIVSREHYERIEGMTLGWSHRRGPAKHDDIERLMLHAGEPDVALPAHVDKSDLDIVANPLLDSTTNPRYINGYTIVAHDREQGIYQYVRNEVDDDYIERPMEPFHEGSVLALADSYRTIGMTGLADALTEHAADLTPKLLESLIRDQSDYSFDASIGESRNFNKLQFAFARFEGQIDSNGRFQTQCTGSAEFLILSLNQLANERVATKVSGFTLPAGKKSRLSAAGHAKVLFAQGGNRIMLDATPGAAVTDSNASNAETEAEKMSWVERLKEMWQERRENRAGKKMAARILKDSRPKDGSRARVEFVDEPTTETDDVEAELEGMLAAQEANRELRAELIEDNRPTVESVRRQVEQQAAIAVSARNRDEMFDSIAQLPESDPLRRTLRLALEDKITDEMLALHKERLQMYAEAPADNLKRAGIRDYDRQIYATLSRLTDELARARR